MTSKLNLDQGAVLLARELARRAGEPVTQLAHTHTTVSIERAVLRLGGLDGADPGGMPWVNRLTDAVRASAGLEHGVALPVWDALRAGGYPDLRTLAEAAAAGRPASASPSAATRWPRGNSRPVRSRPAVRPRPAAGAAGPDDRRPGRSAVSLGVPDRRGGRRRPGRRAGAGGRARRGGRDRGDPVGRAGAADYVPAGGARTAGRAATRPGRTSGRCARPSTTPRASSAATCGSPATRRGCACPRSRPWPGSSGWT